MNPKQNQNEGEEDFQVIQSNASQNPDDIFFNQSVQALQQIIVDEKFQKNQTGFMRKNCQLFEDCQQNQKQCHSVFENYGKEFTHVLENMLSEKINNFSINRFFSLLQARSNQIDDEIYQLLMSLRDFKIFANLMLDYKSAHQQQERFKTLTIKSTKVAEHKKVKGTSENIFGSANVPSFQANKLAPKKKQTSDKSSKAEKSEQEILVPDLVLTVKPLRKE